MSLCVVFVKIKKETQRFERGREKGRGERERERDQEGQAPIVLMFGTTKEKIGIKMPNTQHFILVVT